MIDDLIAFIRARLDEDARTAQAATGGPWHVDSEDYAEAIYDSQGTAVIGGGRWGGEASVFETTEDALHVARHDPARVLAEVEVKRAVIDEALGIWNSDVDGVFGRGESILRYLALPYADQPGYKEIWRP